MCQTIQGKTHKMPLLDIFKNCTYNSATGLQHTQSGLDTIPEAPPIPEQMHNY